MKMCLCCIKCLLQMWKTEDAETSVVWFAPWNVDLTCVVIDFGIISDECEFL